jgi:membrane-bound lytic murein transglycosylase D
MVVAQIAPPTPGPSDSSSTPSPTLPVDEALRLTRILLEAYHDLLPASEVVRSGTPLADLMEALPAHFRRALRSNADYRELYLRRLAGASDIPVVVNDRVREKIRLFQTEAAEVFRTWLHRSGVYGPIIRRALREEGLPEDLIFLSMVESGFSNRAYSRVAAVGMWQFMQYTGRLYGLQVNNYVDERRDPEKATHAAARHLRHLYRLFGNWDLVLTAYNCGEGRLQKALRRHQTEDFWKLRDIPSETLNHLPKVLAALIISKDPAFFGFHDVLYGEPLSYDVVKVSEAVDLRQGAQCAGTSVDVMRALNPELRLGHTPPRTARRPYALRVPRGSADRFAQAYARVPAARRPSLAEYHIRHGDTLSSIARRVGVSAESLAEANGIRNPRTLRPGQRLKVPGHLAAAGLHDPAPDTPPSTGERTSYQVQEGDTLWEIARRHGVSPEQVRTWNAIAPGRELRPGQRLVLLRRTATPEAAALVGPEDRGGSRVVHTVRPGDTLWSIARVYRTSVDRLKSLNGIRNAAQLRVGDRLRVRAEDPNVD